MAPATPLFQSLAATAAPVLPAGATVKTARSRSTSAGSTGTPASDVSASPTVQRAALPDIEYPNPVLDAAKLAPAFLDAPSPFLVRNSFFEVEEPWRPTSLDGFFQERQTKSCLASGIGLPPGLEHLSPQLPAAAALCDKRDSPIGQCLPVSRPPGLPDIEYPSPVLFNRAEALPDIKFPSPMVVRNTFVELDTWCPSSLDGFLQERLVQSCPTSGLGEALGSGSSALNSIIETELGDWQDAYQLTVQAGGRVPPPPPMVPPPPAPASFDPALAQATHAVPPPPVLPPALPPVLPPLPPALPPMLPPGLTVPPPVAPSGPAHIPTLPMGTLPAAPAIAAPALPTAALPPPPARAPELRLSESLPQPALGSPDLPTVGSAGHRFGNCKPCAFVHTKGCASGIACAFCHLCAPGEKKRRQKVKHLVNKLGTDATTAAALVAGTAAAGPQWA